MNAIRRPTRIFVSPRAMGQLHDVAAGDIHDEDIEVSWFKSTSPGKRNVLAIRIPRGIHGVALAGGQTLHVCSINIHSIYLRSAAAPGDKHKIVAGLRIHLRLHVQRAGMSDPLQIAAVQIGLENLRETRHWRWSKSAGDGCRAEIGRGVHGSLLVIVDQLSPGLEGMHVNLRLPRFWFCLRNDRAERIPRGGAEPGKW